MSRSRRLGVQANLLLLLLLLLVALAGPALAAEFPLRDAARLDGEPTDVVRVTTARILLADYPLIRRDFVALRQRSNREIDAWLLSQTAFMARTQTSQSTVNSRIETDEQVTRRAIRPPDYGRGLVFETPFGLIDGKGFGASNPSHRGHGNGLAMLSEAIREWTFSKMVDSVFRHAGQGYQTIAPYAVIDWGFRLRTPAGKDTVPAGAILRRAHRRYPRRFGLIDWRRARPIEELLRSYGIASAGAANASHGRNLINLQGDESGRRIVDFGPMRVLDRFPETWRSVLPDPVRVQPDPKIAVPYEVWGDQQQAHGRLWRECDQLVARQGFGRRAALDYVRSKLRPVRHKLYRSRQRAGDR